MKTEGRPIPAGSLGVLVVDDHETIRFNLARILSRHGYVVETAADANAALAAIERTRFDLVLCDIQMPRMSGLELVAHLRASRIDVPVVLMTGNPLLETAVKALEHGVVRYLTKPVETETLLEVATGAIQLHGLARAKRLALDNDALRSLIDELDRAHTAERAASRAKSEFLARMNHELRTPLAHVMGFTDLALETDLSSEQREYLETSQRSAAALLTLVETILHFSDLDRGEVSLADRTFCPRSALEGAVSPLIATAAKKGIAMTLAIGDEIPGALVGDASRLRQVIDHVAGNAIKFTPAGGTVAVHASVDRDAGGAEILRIEVTDSGIGMSEDVRASIFGAFSQADGSSTRRYGGVGLGLAVSALLVRLMGGEITLTSAVGVGTALTFTARFRRPVVQG
jgi:signal transduction histidine kinase